MAYNQVPLGFRFLPTDEEIVRIFLHKMVVEGQALKPPYDIVLNAEDLFAAKDPWKIWEQYDGNHVQNGDLYFYCQLKCVSQKGSRIDRKVGSGGTWSEGEPSRLIFSCEDQGSNAHPNPNVAIGRRRKFRYEREDPDSEQHAAWFLDEFSIFLPQNPYNQSRKNHRTNTSYDCDFVICRLRKNPRPPAAKKRKSRCSEDQKNPAERIKTTDNKRKCSSSVDEPNPTEMIETSNKKMEQVQDQVEAGIGTQDYCPSTSNCYIMGPPHKADEKINMNIGYGYEGRPSLLVDEKFELNELIPGVRQQFFGFESSNWFL